MFETETIMDELFDDADFASASAVARALEVHPAAVADWADAYGVARLGNGTFAFSEEDVEAFIESLDEEEDDDNDDDEDDDEDDDDEEE